MKATQSTTTTEQDDEPTVKHIQDDGTVTTIHPEWITAKSGYLVYGTSEEKVRVPWRRVVETREPYGEA